MEARTIATQLTQKIANTHPELARGRGRFFDARLRTIVSSRDVSDRLAGVLDSMHRIFGLAYNSEVVKDIVLTHARMVVQDRRAPDTVARVWYNEYMCEQRTEGNLDKMSLCSYGNIYMTKEESRRIDSPAIIIRRE